MNKTCGLIFIIAVMVLPLFSAAVFIDNGDGTVTDSRTGLMWTKDANIAGRDNPASVAAWFVSVGEGYVSCSNRSNEHSVWPVRGNR